MHSYSENLDMARRIASRVRDAGGRAFFVGGYVRDALMGVSGKDIDIEVHGVTPERLAAILDTLGERLSFGSSFGVFGLRHYDIDIAMPRKERATGRGHRDFEIFVDPFIGVEGAARRRDFTVNAMMQDVLSGEIVDCYNGREDLARGVLRHVNDESFAEDALRVLRGAQFAARFGFEIAPETRALCAGMALTALPRERVAGELEKALLKAERPSVFFEELRRMGHIAPWFAELDGDDRDASMKRLDAAAELRGESRMPMALLLAALTAGLSEKARESLLTRLTNDEKLLRGTFDLAGKAFKPAALLERDAPDVEYLKLFDSCAMPEELILLAKACGCADGKPERLLKDYRALCQTPPVSGADLVRSGLKPGPDFSRLLGFARELWLQGVTHDEALRRTLERS